MRSKSEMDTCFDFLYRLEDYIPREYLDGDFAELSFYLHILGENGMYVDEAENRHALIWSTHYDCVYDRIPFIMIHDEDYDMVSFAVDEEYASHRHEIAQHIKQLIEAGGRKKSSSIKGTD